MRTLKERESFTKGLTPRQVAEIEACTQCGECLRYCPVQEVTKRREIAPASKIRMYRDFIKRTESLKAILFGDEVDCGLLEEFTRAVFECTTCGACGQFCPVGIDTQRLWPALRREMVRRGLGPIGPQVEIPDNILRTGNPYGLPAGDRFRWRPELSLPAEAEFGYYAGCTGAYQATPMVRGDLLVLKAVGLEFTMLSEEEEVCCGFPLFITGQHEILAETVRKVVEAFSLRQIRYLVSSCPCCVNMMTKDWPYLYGGPLPFKILHISQVVAPRLKGLSLRHYRRRLIYHDPCYLSRGMGIIQEPRQILRAIPGVELVEFDRHGRESRCCGAGGAARKVFHENAIGIARLSIDEAIQKGAERLVLSCPACYEKVNEALEGYDKQIEVVDIMELIADLIGVEG